MIRRFQHADVSETATRRSLPGSHAMRAGSLDVDMEADAGVDAEAYRHGYAEGFEAGEQDGKREATRFHEAWESETRQRMEDEAAAVAKEREALAQLCEGLNAALRDQAEAMEELAFEVALAGMARAFGAMQGDGELLRRLCTQMVEEYRMRAEKLLVSPLDRARLPDNIGGLVVHIEPDLRAGECRIEMARGLVESSIGARLEAIHDATREALGIERP